MDLGTQKHVSKSGFIAMMNETKQRDIIQIILTVWLSYQRTSTDDVTLNSQLVIENVLNVLSDCNIFVA